jgi:hypothetical protein
MKQEQRTIKLLEMEINSADQKFNGKNAKFDQHINAFENQKQRILEHIRHRLRREDVYQYVKDQRNSFVDLVCAKWLFDDPQSQNVVENRILFAFLVEDPVISTPSYSSSRTANSGKPPSSARASQSLISLAMDFRTLPRT